MQAPKEEDKAAEWNVAPVQPKTNLRFLVKSAMQKVFGDAENAAKFGEEIEQAMFDCFVPEVDEDEEPDFGKYKVIVLTAWFYISTTLLWFAQCFANSTTEATQL